MAVASFDQDTLEDIIATAVKSGLATNDRRSQLLAHLPQRFIDKVELFDDLVEQLRADVLHLNAHPRLPDHHQPPLASWLQNAYLLTTPSDEARVFRQFRNRLTGSGRQQEILRSITRIKKITIPEAERIAAERDQARTPRSGALLGGRFALERKLGQGAVASVWRAKDLAADIPVAVKILHPRWAENPDRRSRFFAGARQMASFSHPHIVPVIIPEGEDAGRFYCVLEYLDAGDLEAALREGRIRQSTGLRALMRVASGVAAMHAMGVMHLDIKPQNILLGSDGRVMLGDFDRVRNAAIEGGSTTDTVESIFYLAPETFDESRTPGPTADVFSLGMTALFVLHGDKLPAWIVRRPSALLRRIDCPDALRAVVSRAIEVDPAARYADVESLAGAFQDALGKPSTALPRIAPLVSMRPSAIKPPRSVVSPGSGPMPRVSAPPRAESIGRSTDSLPAMAVITGQLPAVGDEPGRDGSFRALARSVNLSRTGSLPEIERPPPLDRPPPIARQSSVDLPAPSIPPPSIPPPPIDLPPAGTGELEIEDSVDSALQVLDRAAAAALAEEFARSNPPPDAPDPGSMMVPIEPLVDDLLSGVEALGGPGAPAASAASPPPVDDTALIVPIAESIDLDASVPPADTSGPHASIPGDENRQPWTWIERSGGFMVAEDDSGSDALAALESGRWSVDADAVPPGDDPWRWMSRPIRPSPAEPSPAVVVDTPESEPAAAVESPEPATDRSETTPEPAPERVSEPEPIEEPLPPLIRPAVVLPTLADTSESATPSGLIGPISGALPRVLPDDAFEADEEGDDGGDDPTEQTADDVELPLPRVFAAPLGGTGTPTEPDAAPDVVEPTRDDGAEPLDDERASTTPFRAVEPPPVDDVETPAADAVEPLDPTPIVDRPDRRRMLGFAIGGIATLAAGWLFLRRGDNDPRSAGAPDAALPELDAALPELDAALPEPDAAPPEPDAAIPDAAPPEPDAAPKPRRRRRRKRKPRRKSRRRTPPKVAPVEPTPEPLIEIPDEIQQMLDE